MNLKSEILEYIAAQAPGYLILPTDLMEQFQIEANEVFAHIMMAFKADFVVPRFRIFNEPWRQRLSDIPNYVETEDGPRQITAGDIYMAWERTHVT